MHACMHACKAKCGPSQRQKAKITRGFSICSRIFTFRSWEKKSSTAAILWNEPERLRLFLEPSKHSFHHKYHFEDAKGYKLNTN